MKPYYERGGIVLYHGDCRELLPAIKADCVVTDPPYGVRERTDRLSKGRSVLAVCNDFPPVHGDDAPFDPTPWLAWTAILWGANHYSDRLPGSPSWFVWDKRDGQGPNDNADCEIAWSNVGGPARLFSHHWKGMLRASERGVPRVHPTQKPIALMRWCLSFVEGSVLDPYMGSGTTVLAAKSLGRRAIGIEIEERYCEIAARRLDEYEPLPFEEPGPTMRQTCFIENGGV